MSNTFFILGLAGLEFSFGFLLLILFKNFNVSLNMSDGEKAFSQSYLNSSSVNFYNKYFWVK
jgi:hypothetical protein